MCQSKEHGGKRCFSHNCQQEKVRSKRDARKAKKRLDAARDEILSLKLDGKDVPEDLVKEQDQAFADWRTHKYRLYFSDPKTVSEYRAAMLEMLPEDLSSAAAPVMDSMVNHDRQAAKLAGEAHRSRLFDREDEAEEFDRQADEERSRAGRLADALQSLFYNVKHTDGEALKERLQAAVAAHDELPEERRREEPGVFRSTLTEFLESLDEAVTETVVATGEAVIETAVAAAEVFGGETSDHPAAAADSGQRQSPYPPEAAPRVGLDPDSGPKGGDDGGDVDRSGAADDPDSEGNDADDPAVQDVDGEEDADDPTEKVSTERRFPQPVADDRPVAVDGSVGTDDGQDPVPDPIGPPKAGGIGDRVDGQDQDGPAPTAAAVEHVPLSTNGGAGGDAVDHAPAQPAAVGDHDHLQNQRSGDQVQGLDNPAPTAAARPMVPTPTTNVDSGHVRRSPAAAEPQPADDLDYTAVPIAVPTDLSQLSDDELAALIDHLQARRA